MAIYNNRIVTLTQPIKAKTSIPDMISVRAEDGQTYTVSSGQVKFTKDEKKNMQVETGEKLDTVQVATDEEVEAAKTGILPSTHPEVVARAEQQVRDERIKAETQKNLDKAKVEADKALNTAKKDTK